ncbi:unnamed protein product [Larinioides sclopetarius]|uniref:BTB domain-containing protein n=1 Tax=Larinioides sclopetarius TaxID=280406 RepID=A0AAV2AAA4_9ARAC
MGATTSASNERRPHFTCIWEIENGSSLEIDESLSSPIFTAKSIENTKWSLRLCSDSSDIDLYIYREEEDNGLEEIEIDYELSFLGTNGLPLVKKADTYTFFRQSRNAFIPFAIKYDIFSSRRTEFLPRNVLTIRYQMWKRGTEIPIPDTCFIRTRMGIDSHCFVWPIKDFSTLSLGHKTIRKLKSTSEGAPNLTLIFCSKQFEGQIYVCIDIDSGDVMKSFHVAGKIYLLNAEGIVVDFKRIYEFIESTGEYQLCSKFFERKKLLDDKYSLLPNDVLSLRYEIEIFYSVVWSKVENSTEVELEINADVKKRLVEDSFESSTDDCPFRQKIRRFFEDGIFSDVALRTDSETFMVHKILLSSRSPVFKAMFTNDMREKASNCIDVPDVNAGTLRRLLLYIYTNKVQVFEWDKIADLLRAADKYELLELKDLCSSILKSNISSSNVCCILSLADMHHDEDLYKEGLDFVSKNLDIFSSDAWGIFKTQNSRLAMETMEKVAYKVSDSFQKNLCAII